MTGTTGSGGPGTSARLKIPHGLMLSNISGPLNDDLFIVDSSGASVRLLFANQTVIKVAGVLGTSGFSGDGGLGQFTANLVLMSWIVKFYIYLLCAAVNARLGNPYAISSGPNNSWLIADQANAVIRQFYLGGIISTIAGIAGQGGYTGDGGVPTSARLGLAVGTCESYLLCPSG